MEAHRREEDVGNGLGIEGFKDFLLGSQVRAVAGDDECDGEVVLEDESFGQLDEGNEVAKAWGWDDSNMRWFDQFMVVVVVVVAVAVALGV